MKKCLMIVMAAVALGGMFSGCSKEIESLEGGSSANSDVIKKYEVAFITRFGQPAANQTWGFGSAASSTRAGVVPQPSVTEMGYTFNATMAKAWEGIDGTPTVMANYTSWRNSGWNDKFYQVNGTVVSVNIDATLREKAYTAILEKIPEGGPGNGQNNLTTASATGYSIVTKGGPVTLTPIYHNSSSGDMISYYYYPQGSNPDVKTLPKYTIGNMADPATCQSDHNALNSNTYSLVYVGENGPTYEFPENYVINFMVSNTDQGNQQLTIADDIIVAQKDWTGVDNLDQLWYQFDNNGSANMVADGISFTVNNFVNYWQPQANVLEGFNLARGENYKVVIVAKFPCDGKLQINMGNWGGLNVNNFQYAFDVEATGDFQEVECDFSNYGADVTNGHVLFQCGDFQGTTIFKSVKVIKLATKTTANTPEFYGDGTYNMEVHQSTIPLGDGYHWAVTPPDTPHIAVFNTEYTDNEGKTVDLNLIGFEDWTDLDFNDVIFAVTGTSGGEEIEIEEPDPEPEPVCRIITEDLNATDGENDDFDFNDVVFDVCPDVENNSTILIIRCIGGELPLYIAQAPDAPLDESHEVHNICNIGARSMTNTGWDGAINYNKECGRLVLPGVVINSREGAWGIRITVVKKGVPYELTAKRREVPSKICVGPTYEWCSERLDIDKKYHQGGNKYFSMYVAGELGDDWENGSAWYQQPIGD